MKGVVADTHAVVWYLLSPNQLSSRALAALDEAGAEGGPILLSAISVVEIHYLVEKHRLPEALLLQLFDLLADPQSPLVVAPLDEAVARAVGRVSRDEVPDMPDRIILATALHTGLPLVSRDAKIRAAHPETVW